MRRTILSSVARCGGGLLILSIIISCETSSKAVEPNPADFEFFESRIRPVLIQQCYECHNTAKSAEGGLALDSRGAVLKGGNSGPALVAGKLDQSLLLKVLRHEVEGQEMPQGRPQLSKSVILDFHHWISAGAADPREAPPSAADLARAMSWETVLEQRKQWWSFQPIRSHDPPAVKDESWSEHPIDRFILARLEQDGLRPAQTADAESLVRRAFFVLTGLPPSREELGTWRARLRGEGSERDRNFEELVDYLLASPHFGEHWARHWMDWVRYADSHGSEGDPQIGSTWIYRDYLVRALNVDVPYHQLLREHIAGDLLEDPRINEELKLNESAIGPAHWRMVFHGFSPTDALDEKVRFVDDDINVFAKAFLGLTISCARCHDHKFDAISQQDYYALFGIVGSCRPARTVVDVREVQQANYGLLQNLKPAIREAIARDWREAIPQVIEKLLAQKPAAAGGEGTSPLEPWRTLQQALSGDKTFAEIWQARVEGWQEDRRRREAHRAEGVIQRWNFADKEVRNSWFAAGIGLDPGSTSAGEFAINTKGPALLQGIYPAGVITHALSEKHPARFTSQTLMLDGEYDVWLLMTGDGAATARYVVQHYPRGGTIFPILKASAGWKWQKMDASYWRGDEIHLELSTALDAPLPTASEVRSWFGIREVLLMRKGSGPPPATTQEHLDALFELTVARPPQNQQELADCYRRALTAAVEAWQRDEATDAQACFLNSCLESEVLPNTPERLPSAAQLVAEYRRLEEEIPVPRRVPGLDETIGRDQPLFVRGDHHQPADTVPRRFLEAVDATPYESPLSGRRQLAEDLLRPDNPLTRRVVVNRLWHHVFGQGIVGTPDNFGRLGMSPTHPELLDWLALRFSDRGWSIKGMIREMITSRTWQLASTVEPLNLQRDPENLMLSHAPLRRLDAESIRDSLLAVSGELDLTAGGPGVGSGAPRRSIYLEVRRNSLVPFLRVFDFPEPFSTTGRRDLTNVPAQSLTMMNDPSVMQAASHWAERILAAGEMSEADRIQRMFQSALSRPPTTSEVEAAQNYLIELRRIEEELRRERRELNVALLGKQAELSQLLDPLRVQLLSAAREKLSIAARNTPAPISQWDFEGDLKDSIGHLHGQAFGDVKFADGGVVFSGNGYVITSPLEQTLRAKTLQVWVQLADLTQRGGAAMMIQTPRGEIFDAVVFGEKAAGHWIAGSDHWRRTQDFQGAVEASAVQKPVHLAIVYDADGRITGYRDGQIYGHSYQSHGPVEFTAEQAVVGFGIRHLPAGGNKLLAGRLLRAQLYDRALTSDEVWATSQMASPALTDEEVIASLSEPARQQAQMLRQSIASLADKIETSVPVPGQADELALWTDLARGLFQFKEFIYLR